MSSTVEILRGLPYFSDLPEALLEKVCDETQQIDIPKGTVIIEEGSHSEEMYIVVDGELVVTKDSGGGKEVELARIGSGNVVGEIALLDGAPRTATVSALIDTHAIRVPVTAFEDLLSDPRVVRRMFQTVTSRLRGIEDTLRHEERMAALGRMAAQLMHELNNPAAAVARSTQELARLQAELGQETAALAAMFGDEIELPGADDRPTLSPLERGDAEDAIATWLEGQDIAEPWDIAPALVDSGWTRSALEKAVSGAPDETRGHLTRWIGLRAASDQVVHELGIGAGRISELVRVVKDYSFLDRAPIQEVDVASGIRDTLILLKHKLRSVKVTLEFDDDIQGVEAPGRDLNQVWTNLIDNAADALEGGGELLINVGNHDQEVVVTVVDNGPGIPDDVASRIFDPFFTTKEPGKGTGLGLHTVHTIIARIGGTIKVSSDASGTTFEVRLPAIT